MTKINRLDPEYLREWRANFSELSHSFVAGHITTVQAFDVLEHLGFRGEALRIEILELQRSRREAQGPALKLVVS